jgi:uncharacterized membrane protein
MKFLLPAISGFGLAVYPLVVLVGMRFLDLGTLWIGLLILVTLRVISARWFQRLALLPRLAVLIALAVLSALPAMVNVDFMIGLRFYPVVANLALFSLFFASLFTERPLAERLARLREKDLPPQGIRYTRRVTQVWVLFLLANLCVATATALWASDLVWALYNGGIAYGLVVLLFSLEYLYRQRARRTWSRP